MMKARMATTDTPQTACGSKELEFPFPVSPSGGKPGRAGSPHVAATSRASQYRWHVPCAPLPPQEGLRPLVHPPACDRGSINCPVESIRTMDFNPNKLLPMSSESSVIYLPE